MSKARDLAGLFNLGSRSGTTAQRPATADVGDIYYNGTTGKTEIYTTTGWQEMASGIPFGNTAGRPTAVTGQPYFNGETARLEMYTATGWQNIVQEVPGVASITGNYSEATNSGTITIAGTNFVSGAIASAIGTNGVEVLASSTTYNSLVQITAAFTGLSNAYEPYDIKVTNPSNLFGLIPDALYINASPVWQTASGSLGSFIELVNITLSALSSTDSDSTVTYTLAPGSSLPSGVTLNSTTGVISGTLPNISTQTTYSFTVNATDGVNTIPRIFSITSDIVSISGGLLASDLTYYYRVFPSSSNFISNTTLQADILLIGGGGSGASWTASGSGGGGGAGGIIYFQNKSLSAGSYSCTVGDGAAASSSGADGTNGSNSIFGSLTPALGGGGGGAYNSGDRPGLPGGSGGGASGAFGASGGATTQTGTGATSFYGFRGGNSVSGSPYNAVGGGGSGGQGIDGGGSGAATAGGVGTSDFSSWLSAINSSGVMSSVSGWSTATSAGRIASGGGGGGGSSGQTGGSGGVGGGGAGGTSGSSSNVGVAGITNTGSGGGGSGPTNPSSGAGGKGLIVVRYTKASVGG
jgi:hypothetical protein